MAHTTHDQHEHTHGAACGHTAVKHDDHTDYVHDGHLHSLHGDHVDEHAIATSATNPDKCTQGHGCTDHDASHKHASGCGHEQVPHGDHVDYVVSGHLHHQHAEHCDNHGVLATA